MFAMQTHDELALQCIRLVVFVFEIRRVFDDAELAFGDCFLNSAVFEN